MINYPSSGPESFGELLEPLPREIGEVTGRLRAILHATLPDADAAVSGGAKMGMALYSIGGANNIVCGIQPTETVCKLLFHGWERLKEAGYRLEGSGKHARHVKLRSALDLEPERVADMIRIASEHVRAD